MRRVLMTVDAVGGVWRYAMELAQALGARGIDVIFAGSGPRPAPDQEREARRVGEIVWMDQPLDWMAADETALASVAGEIAATAARTGADLLHLNLPSQAARLEVDLPIVTVSHSCVVTWWNAVRGDGLPPDWAWQRQRNLDGFRRSTIVVAPSSSHAQALRRCYGPIDVEVVANAVTLPARNVRAEPFIFAAARWWDEGKNGAVLDRAAAGLPWPVLAAGAVDGPNGQHSAFAHARRLGQLSHREVLARCERAGLFVSPSRYEPFGLSALEAARLGRALVLADIPTYRELWDGAAAFFDPDDTDALAHLLTGLADDPDARDALAAAAHDRSWRYTTERQAGQMVALYASAADRNGNIRREQFA